MDVAVKRPIRVVLKENVVAALPKEQSVRIVHPVGRGKVVVSWPVGIRHPLQSLWINQTIRGHKYLPFQLNTLSACYLNAAQMPDPTAIVLSFDAAQCYTLNDLFLKDDKDNQHRDYSESSPGHLEVNQNVCLVF